ncbi:hypothetical protein N0V83_002013 [Neocucurbitaria cava]|uniref:Uncharacterized protein n=1 Tax=Neocucurbitaria cava TaxID=798079 RepID=A0A9W8YDA4_9PLEO|nr:hypothetical protein N0V83_002013 [Neocucurbitaria cava]
MGSQVHKRAFSEAFNPESPDSGDADRQAVRSVPNTSSAAYRPSSFTLWSSSPEKENDEPVPQTFLGLRLDHILNAPRGGPWRREEDMPAWAIVNQMELPGHTLPALSLRALPPQDRDDDDVPDDMLPEPAYGQPRLDVPTLQGADDQLPMASSPPSMNPQHDGLPDEEMGPSMDAGPGPVIYEELDNDMSDQSVPAGGPFTPTGPLTPMELNFNALSLLDVPESSSPISPSQSVAQFGRTKVYTVESACFGFCFPEILPEEVILAYDKGAQLIKMDKYPLTLLIVKPLYTHCIRLRDDFPYAIAAMVEFIESAHYTFDTKMRAEYPHITLLDLHVHAYLVGSKYEVPTLCEHAVVEFISVASMILSQGIPPDPNDMDDMFDDATPGPRTSNSANTNTPRHHDPNDGSPAATTHRFLDSLVLLWRNTADRDDAMRAAALELIKPLLSKLMKLRFFIVMMLELLDFGDDVCASLVEDGFSVTGYPVPPGMKRRWAVRFGEVRG